MTHLILCREYPPAPYAAGGIGTYVKHIARLLANAGETVHLIAQRWEGAAERTSEEYGGKLIVHRIALDEPICEGSGREGGEIRLLRRLSASDCPSQVFSWQAARLAETLVKSEPIDVIEAQEWEAPLYYLQVRRALGLGPSKAPPCLVHLHSPSRLIFRHNEWDETLTDFLPLCRLEEYTVRSADALICPSRYLARQAEELFHLAQGTVEVVPYPMGDTPFIARAEDAWVSNAISYVGRLELRKGVIEWVDAAVRICDSHPSVTFEFTGSDTSLGGGMGGSVQEYLKDRIPRSLRSRFVFHGARSRAEVLRSLAAVSVAVVPSRWENLPFTCIEAMSTGLPVLASPNGGMSELVADGESGWVARDGSPAGLEAALCRALDTSPSRRAEMGEEAVAAVRRICGNEVVLQKHLQLRARIARSGALKSRRVPSDSSVRHQHDTSRSGVGIVATCFGRSELLRGCLESIAGQILPPRMNVLVAHERYRAQIENLMPHDPDRLTVIYSPDISPGAANWLGAEMLLAAAPHLRCIAWIVEDTRLDASYVSACDSAFDRQPDLGVVSPWVSESGHQGELHASPCPISTAGFAGDDLLKFAAIRVEVVLAAAKSSGGAGSELAAQSIWSALAADGWGAVTWPGILVSVSPPAKRVWKPRKRYSAMAYTQSDPVRFALRWFLAAPWGEKIACVRQVLSKPRRIVLWLGWQSRRARTRVVGPARSS